MGVNRSTIHHDMPDLGKRFAIIAHDDGRITIDRAAYLVRVSFSLHEALAVHLASRLLSTRMDRQNPNAAAALRKLGLALERLAPRISQHVQQSADIMDETGQRQDPRYLEVLEQLTLAWAEQQKIRIRHRYEGTGTLIEYTFSPYFIEPYAVGQTTHLIGRSEGDKEGKLRTLKIERIEQVIPTREPYEIPISFDPRDLLADAWGVWYTGGEPVNVALKFHPRVARRVQETRWHRSEDEKELPDGSILWQAKVAEPQEMLPWIRGWGADVEVLEPEGLRKALVREAERLARLYKVVAVEAEKTQYYGHSRRDKDKSEWQLLLEHLTNTAALAGKFGQDAGLADLAQIAGLLHDIGKYSTAFQARLDGATRKVDHATAGAKEVRELFKQDQTQQSLATLLAYCIAGHHTGLPNYGDSSDVDADGTLLSRIEKKKLEDFTAYKTEIDPATLIFPAHLKTKPDKKYPWFSYAFVTRMLFSALVDADFQDTEEYITGKKPRGDHESIDALCEKLNTYLRQFNQPSSEINRKRTETLIACVEKSTKSQGFFTLTVPTGGGKTLASMAFALNHAVKHGLKRIIYVIPFTSIIEQNAAVFKNVLGETNVLEHHSNFDWKKKSTGNTEPDDESKDALDKLKLASENWDIPVVVTTNVQFFELLFANKSSRCRKLHNIAKSVIIFDEAQMLPRDYLDPCMLAVKELVQNYGASTIFCTATQPALGERLLGVSFTELAPDPQSLFEFYRRVQVKNIGKLRDAELLEKVAIYPQVLCIVNTRKHAKGLFDALPKDEGNFHLSTLMCPTHRKQQLLEIRARLKAGMPCRVISTQVMEAGIDVDFPVGFRSLAGLDSIIQAAGRVNREGKNVSGELFVFEPDTAFIKKIPTFVQQGASVAANILRDYNADPVSVVAINAYFRLLNHLQDPKRAFDVKEILKDLNKGDLNFDFKTAAEKFSLIENNTVAVVIPYTEEARKLIERARFHPFPYQFARQLQMYTVNIYENEFEKLQSKGVIELCNETYQVLTNIQDYYDEHTGLTIPADAGGDALFFDG